MLQSYYDILNRSVANSLGRAVAEVFYRTYVENTPQSAVDAGAGWFHGEVQLQFEDAAVLFLSWGENEGFEDHFSLLPSETSTYDANTLVSLPALASPEWRLLRAQPLIEAQLLGANGTPHILVLRFTTGGVGIGDGHHRAFGDGDQILVHTLPDPQLVEFSEVFWRVSAV